MNKGINLFTNKMIHSIRMLTSKRKIQEGSLCKHLNLPEYDSLRSDSEEYILKLMENPEIRVGIHSWKTLIFIYMNEVIYNSTILFSSSRRISHISEDRVQMLLQ